jgi:hypothetical protein
MAGLRPAFWELSAISFQLSAFPFVGRPDIASRDSSFFAAATKSALSKLMAES